MTKKTLLVLAGVILLGLGGYYFIRSYFHIVQRAVIISIKASAQNIAEKLPQGAALDKPLKIPAGFRIAVFCRFK